MDDKTKNKIQHIMEGEMKGALEPQPIPIITEIIEKVGREENICSFSFNKTELKALRDALWEGLVSPGTRRFDRPTKDSLIFPIDRWIIKSILRQFENLLTK